MLQSVLHMLLTKALYTASIERKKCEQVGMLPGWITFRIKQ